MKVLLPYKRPWIVLGNASPDVDDTFSTSVCFLFLSFASVPSLSFAFFPLSHSFPVPFPHLALPEGKKSD